METLKTIPQKCKLELIQPYIKCGGRDDVKCHYRGKIIGCGDNCFIIQFKYKGEVIERLYYLDGTGFHEDELKDIKLVK